MDGGLKGSPRMTRRSLIGGITAGALAPAVLRAAKPGSAAHIAVIGAGVFGSWTAEHLRRAGHQVTLVDMAGPANNRASSGGESRMTRGAYGKDEIYSKMAFASLPEWKALSAASGLPIFVQHGVLFSAASRTITSRIPLRCTGGLASRSKSWTAASFSAAFR
jgi:glycine/D-amino acid oxidase-like deaminating enzyme